MDKVTAMTYLHEVILNRFPPGPDREHWLAWLSEFSHAEETLETLPGALILHEDEPPHEQQPQPHPAIHQCHRRPRRSS